VLRELLTCQLVFDSETPLNSDPLYGVPPHTNVFTFLPTQTITMSEWSTLVKYAFKSCRAFQIKCLAISGVNLLVLSLQNSLRSLRDFSWSCETHSWSIIYYLFLEILLSISIPSSIYQWISHKVVSIFWLSLQNWFLSISESWDVVLGRQSFTGMRDMWSVS